MGCLISIHGINGGQRRERERGERRRDIFEGGRERKRVSRWGLAVFELLLVVVQESHYRHQNLIIKFSNFNVGQ